LSYGTCEGFALAIQEDIALERSLAMYEDATLGRMFGHVSFWISYEVKGYSIQKIKYL